MSKFVAMRPYYLLMTGAWLLSACANIIPPNGGEKDTAPPEVVRNTAANFPVNFDKHTIEIILDELIVTKDLSKQFYTSPPLKSNPKVTAKGKSITISWEESLQESTTYHFHFGSSIADFNEGNILPNYSFEFSTGRTLDTLSLSGTLLNAQSKTPPKEAFAALYIYNVSNSDSLLYLSRPDYLAKIDAEGRFHFSNLKEGQYVLFALGDEDRSLTFSLAEELVGFHNQIISPSTPPITLLLFNEKSIADTLSPIATDSLTEYGNLIIDSLPNTVLLLEVLKNDKLVRQCSATQRTVIDSLPAGSYQIRIVTDSNQNGVWDTGNLLGKKQAEIIQYYPEEVQLRANWDLTLIWRE